MHLVVRRPAFRVTGAAAREQGRAALGQGVLLWVLWWFTGLGAFGVLVGAGHALGLGALLAWARRRAGRRSLGPADRVTLARAVLGGGVTALVADGADAAALVVLAAVALALDAVDGVVARRTGTASAFGARFDMEADAFLILVLSARVALAAGGGAWWVLAIGAMRYAFAGARRVWPWLGGELPPSTARKTVAAAQGILLAAACAGCVPMWAAGVALAALVWSFARDIARLHVDRRPHAAHRPRVLAGVARPRRDPHRLPAGLRTR
ncbi:CDP-alcohol phosphatidyltransferase family protein [Actinomadura parmotrematis]|uniref:CDP-alcohol phosphatidyltransferase family protein n=1 Tax=Actinomadura parmotrematis TaxID=2864039 RepID=A0ABS7FNI4_9ACTN|nr:CDP-alcohol phosphatidyltransferase family protein [Actinomadura parmotrematis]MBW8481329.1 CDP-alcohol phosphatidyltransferase family protein [Actinomadura parmotrematis]